MYNTETGNKSSINIITVGMTTNPQRIFLLTSLDRIRSIRVKSIAWNVAPYHPDSLLLHLSCPELLIHAPDQSFWTTNNPSLPSEQNGVMIKRNLLASWVVASSDKLIPNSNYNDPQPTIQLSKQTSIMDFTLTLEDDGTPGLMVIEPSDRVMITLELEIQI